MATLIGLVGNGKEYRQSGFKYVTIDGGCTVFMRNGAIFKLHEWIDNDIEMTRSVLTDIHGNEIAYDVWETK